MNRLTLAMAAALLMTLVSIAAAQPSPPIPTGAVLGPFIPNALASSLAPRELAERLFPGNSNNQYATAVHWGVTDVWPGRTLAMLRIDLQPALAGTEGFCFPRGLPLMSWIRIAEGYQLYSTPVTAANPARAPDLKVFIHPHPGEACAPDGPLVTAISPQMVLEGERLLAQVIEKARSPETGSVEFTCLAEPRTLALETCGDARSILARAAQARLSAVETVTCARPGTTSCLRLSAIYQDVPGTTRSWTILVEQASGLVVRAAVMYGRVVI